MSAGLAIRKMRQLQPDNPVDHAVDDMATVSKDRVRREVEKRKHVPNSLADEIKKALG